MVRADIAGGLLVEFDSGFIPDLDTAAAVSVLDAGTVNGRFDVAFVPGLPLGSDGAGRFIKVVYPGGAARNAGGATIALKKGAAHDIRAKDMKITYPEPRSLSRGVSVSVALEVDTLLSNIDLGGSDNFTVGGQPASAAAGMLDGDSDIDLVVTIPDAADPTGTAGSIVVLPNDGNNPDGSWKGFASSTILPSGIDPADVAVGEFDGEPGLDIAVINRAENNISILLNNGSGGFTLHSNTTVNDEPRALVADDLNADGLADVAVIGATILDFPNPGTTPGLPVVTVLLNSGPSGGGAWPGLATPQNFAVGVDPDDINTGDFDDDDDCDLVVLGTDTVVVLTNLGGLGAGWNGFDAADAHPVGNQPSSSDTGDLDNNGFIDIVTTNVGDGTISVLLSSASGFAPVVNLPVGNNPTSIAAVDLDQTPDGDLDLAVVVENDSGEPIVQVLRNDLFNQQLVFAPASEHLAGTGPLLVLKGDVDADGDDDLITVNAQTGGALFRGASTDDVTVLMNVPTVCDGDANSDQVIDVNDISYVLFRLGQANGACGEGDVNGDAANDVNDISYVLFRLGTCNPGGPC